ncbi:Peptidoglycan-N-acetylmuramic acid deacetylase PdaC [Pseudodesulfovibrio hydrargyri]|uniref:Peptidoglycan-N-acetylmuramic acid deacetylase PdaC n=1 Tax=Pseudodesulfovibrio hydrargyri TaxID=2125990 RepID=A0A1J5N061_9BACT|nr:DUF3298 and DUF4163 domain-containing protein [Pseudodesulfovibrio hydrargyri]OIQ52189.1 Peptidoglycan-N-acetylmuramic acid deacetylase PdaC [Pseudodesulfovibrio hydrargyri]
MPRRLTLPTILFLLLGPSTLWAAPLCSPPVLGAVTIGERTPGFKVDAEYPVLCRAEPTRAVRDYVSGTVHEFKKTDPDHDLHRFPHPYELITRYAVWATPGGRYISVKLHVMAYTGGAHPNNWPMTWVFDMEDGGEITLDRLFPDREAALAKVSGLCREVLSGSLGGMLVPDMLDAGLTPTADNFSRFVLTREGVAFFFGPYQVAPYAAGEQVVTIPYDRLGGLMAPGIASTARGD